MLAGYAEAGLIQDASRVDPEPGEWYQSRYHWLWVVSTDTEHRTANCLLFHRQSAVIEDHNLVFSRFHGTRYRRLEELPAEVITRPYMQALLQRLVVEREERQVASNQAREFKKRPDPEQVRAETVAIQQALARIVALLPDPPEADPF